VEANSKNMSKDVLFALRRGTMAQVITLALDTAQRAAENKLAFNNHR
jgi:hypothetical protein